MNMTFLPISWQLIFEPHEFTQVLRRFTVSRIKCIETSFALFTPTFKQKY